MHPLSDILLYKIDEDTTRAKVRMTGETFWLNRNQMALHTARGTR